MAACSFVLPSSSIIPCRAIPFVPFIPFRAIPFAFPSVPFSARAVGVAQPTDEQLFDRVTNFLRYSVGKSLPQEEWRERLREVEQSLKNKSKERLASVQSMARRASAVALLAATVGKGEAAEGGGAAGVDAIARRMSQSKIGTSPPKGGYGQTSYRWKQN